MAAHLESVLARLLVPDNTVIQQATQELREYVKDPAVVPALCTVLTTSQSVQIRQYAAVLLRRRIIKTSQWRSLPPDTVSNIRENILQVLVQEQEATVRKSIAEVVGTIAKHDLAAGNWPQLFGFIEQYTSNDNIQLREMGFYVLSTVSNVAPEALDPHVTSLLSLCASGLEERSSVDVPLHAIQVLKSLTGLIGSDTSKTFQPLIPKIMAVIKSYLEVDEEKAVDAMEILDELIESEVGLIVPYVASIVHVCLEIASNKERGDAIRIKGLSFVSWLTRLKKKALVRLKLVEPVTAAAFNIMCEDIDDSSLDDEAAEANTAAQFAVQVLDVLALHLPPEKFIPHLMRHVEPGLQHENANVRRAAFTAIGVCCEGCADHIRTKYVEVLVQCVYRGLNDESPQVRNAALFAVGHFSEHLQPHISKYSAELLPLLFGYLSKVQAEENRDPRGIVHSYFALEMFCENLGKDIIPYLPTLMSHLLKTVESSPSAKAQELAIGAVGATASAAGEAILPYFSDIMTQLKRFLTLEGHAGGDAETTLKLQQEAIDSLAVVARAVGADTFRPLCDECVQLGLNLLSQSTDPDLRRCIFGLFAAVSTMMGAEMAPYLESIVKQLIETLTSAEGITSTLPTEDLDVFKMFDEENIEDDEDDDDSESPQELEFENAYIDEKEDACQALGEIAYNTGLAFQPHMEEAYREVSAMIDFVMAPVRRSAVTALGQLCRSAGEAAKQANSAETYAAAQSLLRRTIPDILRVAREDTDREAASMALQALHDAYSDADPALLLHAVPELVLQTLNCVKDVFLKRMACQEEDAESVDVELGEDAELDAMLIENAGDVIPALARVVGGTTFVPYFQQFLPDLVKKLKPGSTTADKSFALGVVGETLEALGGAGATFCAPLYAHFLPMTRDEDEEVRSNAVFGLGVIALHGAGDMQAKYPELLKNLFALMGTESDARVRDNIVAAVCRMMSANAEGVPLDQVIPVVVQHLPLKEDLEENLTVYKCLGQLYAADNVVVLQNLKPIIVAVSHVLMEKKLKPELKTLLQEFVQSVNQRCPDQLEAALDGLSPDHVARLQACCSVANGHS